MKKTYIYVLTLSALPNDKHMAIAAFMAEALKMYSIADTVVARFTEAYLAAYDNENKAYRRIDRKKLTKMMNEADADRINALRIVRDAVKIFLIVKDEAKRAQAEQLLDVIDLYGGADIYNMPVDSRTGVLTNLVEDLESALADAVKALDIESTVENLRAANELFLKCQSDRDKSDAEYGKNAVADARVETDNIWRVLVEEVNNAIAYGTDEDCAALVPFAKYMNVEIDKYRVQTGQGVGGSTKPKPDEGEESEDDGNVMLTFEKADETVITLTGMPGESYEIPPLVPGCIWVKKEGELVAPNGIFPAEDMTFIEVPVGEMKSAGFHFTNGEHETFYGLPGTEYKVPASSGGYYWVPQPTGRIPQVDTQYFETVVPELDERPKYRITFRADGRVVAIQEYYEGETIVPPECPEGFEWPDDLPEVMPARNFVVIGIETD